MTDTAAIVLKATQQVAESLKSTFKAQGHVDTGRLLDTMAIKVSPDGLGATGQIFVEKYGIFVNFGVRADRVRYPIQVMIDWWERRGLPTKEATRAAWATRAKHQREGIPTRAASAFSQTGERTGFVERGVSAVMAEVEGYLAASLGAAFEVKFSQLQQIQA